jgi:hypothetical protein
MKDGADINGKGGVVIEEGIAIAVVGIWHPANGEVSISEGDDYLVYSLQQTWAVPTPACIEQPRST